MAGKSIKDLCKPLSAKVMPKKYLYGPGGKRLSNKQAIAKQRQDNSSDHTKGGT